MARVPPIEDDRALPSDLTAFFDGAEQLLAFVSNATRTFAHVPVVAKWLVPMIAAIQRGGSDAILDPRIKEMAIIRTSTLNACHF